MHTGTTVRQASRAAGVRLIGIGDGEYTSSKAPGLVLETGWGPQTCHVTHGRVVRMGAGNTLRDSYC
jgi:hypothetical protein